MTFKINCFKNELEIIKYQSNQEEYQADELLHKINAVFNNNPSINELHFDGFNTDDLSILNFINIQFLNNIKTLKFIYCTFSQHDDLNFLTLFNNIEKFSCAFTRFPDAVNDFGVFYEKVKNFLATKEIKIFDFEILDSHCHEIIYFSSNVLPSLPSCVEKFHLNIEVDDSGNEIEIADNIIDENRMIYFSTMLFSVLIGLYANNSIKKLSLDITGIDAFYLPTLLELCKKPYHSISLAVDLNNNLDSLISTLAKNSALKSLKLSFYRYNDANIDLIISAVIRGFVDSTIEEISLNLGNFGATKLDQTIIDLISVINNIKLLRHLDFSNIISIHSIPSFFPALINSNIQKLSFFTRIDKANPESTKKILAELIKFHVDNETNLMEFDLVEKILAKEPQTNASATEKELYHLAQQAQFILNLNKAKSNKLNKQQAPSLLTTTAFFIKDNKDAKKLLLKNIERVPITLLEAASKSLEPIPPSTEELVENNYEPPNKQLRTA